MPTVALQVTIADYAEWRRIFDKNKPLADKAGFTNTRVYRNADDPHEVIIWGDASNGAKVRRALSSPEFKAVMQESGVIGPPKLHVIPFSETH